MNYLDDSKEDLPDDLVGMIPIGEGGLSEVEYRHYFELKHLKKIVKFTHDMNVLELGCGNGRWIRSLAHYVNHYTGVDFSKKALNIARKKTMWIGNVSLYNQSIVNFWCRRTRMLYDVVYFGGVSQYIEDDEMHTILDNLKSCVKPTTVIVDRSTVNLEKRGVIKTDEYHSIYRTSQELKDIYEKHGYGCIYQKQSYRYLRGKPISLNNYIMLLQSYILDLSSPVKKDWSHDFFVFMRV